MITAECGGWLVSSPYVSLEYRRAEDRDIKTSSSSKSCRFHNSFLEDVKFFLNRGLWRTFLEFHKDVLQCILSLRTAAHLDECVLERFCSRGVQWHVSIGWMCDELQPRENLPNVWGCFLIEVWPVSLRRNGCHAAG